MFVYLLGRSMSLPLVPAYYQSSNLTVADIGIVIGTFAVVFLISEAAWGFVSDVLRRRSTVFLLVAASSFSSLVYTRPEPLWVLILVQLFSAACLGGIGLFPRLTISRVEDQATRGSSFGYLGLVFAVGPMAGAIAGAFVAGWVGMSDTFVLVTGASLLSLVPLLFVDFRRLPQARSVSTGQETPRSDRASPRLLGRVQLVVVGAVGLTYSTATSFYSLLFPNILTKDPAYHATVLEVAVVIAVFSLSSGVLQPLMVSLSSKNPRRWIVVGLLVTGATFFLLLGYRPLTDVYGIAFIAGASVAVTAPLALVVLSSGIAESRLGRALGIFGAAEDFGILVGGSLGTFIWALSGPDGAYAALGLQCVLVGAAVAITLSNPIKRSNPV